uniref:Nef protein n=1 Tax=Human immunodeficiency virus type 1 TaxID=11676 RepID=Q00E57_HV1|nr:nef protein [Human immunodeficiency virus 1]
MGGKWSKSSTIGWPKVRDRMRRAEPAARGGGTSISRPGKTWGTHKHAIQATNNADCAWLEAQRKKQEMWVFQSDLRYPYGQ